MELSDVSDVINGRPTYKKGGPIVLKYSTRKPKLMVSPIEELEDLITNGIVLDIFEAEQALALDELIGINAKAINEQRFGSLFRSFQIILPKCFILAISRLYERPNPKYYIRSIPVALKLLQEYADELPVKRKPSVISRLSELGYDIEELQVMSDKKITLKIVKHFSCNLPTKDIISDINRMQNALNMLTNVRNKAIAHHEIIDKSELKIPSYSIIDRLVDQAKMFVIIVGGGYLGLNYELDGRYLHSSNAKRASRSLRRLLIKVGILEDV